MRDKIGRERREIYGRKRRERGEGEREKKKERGNRGGR